MRKKDKADEAEGMILISQTQLEDLIEKTIQRSIKTTFLTLGVDIDKPIELQHDFSHLRKWRQNVDLLAQIGLKQIFKAIVWVIVAGGILLWIFFSGGASKNPADAISTLQHIGK